MTLSDKKERESSPEMESGGGGLGPKQKSKEKMTASETTTTTTSSEHRSISPRLSPRKSKKKMEVVSVEVEEFEMSAVLAGSDQPSRRSVGGKSPPKSKASPRSPAPVLPLVRIGSKLGGLALGSLAPESPQKTKTTPTAAPEPQQKKSRKVSLAPNDKNVILSREKWLQEEKAKIANEKATDWEAIFKDMAKEQGKEELTKVELTEAFKKMGKRIDEEMINKVFVLFDANGDGVVDLTEFMVAMLFLSYRGSAKDKVELAFRLFDTNRSGDVSKREFSEMISSIIGTSIPTLLQIKEAKNLFREALEQEFAAESLDFIDAMAAVKEKYPLEDGKGSIPVKEARTLYQKYIIEGAPEQVNVSDLLRQRVGQALEEAGNNESMSWASLFAAEKEVFHLLERDKLPRFKKHIRTEMDFADLVWENFQLDPDEGMTIEEFRRWSNLYPHIFDFLDDMQQIIVNEENMKEAALRIQRAARRRAQHKRNVSTMTSKRLTTASGASRDTYSLTKQDSTTSILNGSRNQDTIASTMSTISESKTSHHQNQMTHQKSVGIFASQPASD